MPAKFLRRSEAADFLTGEGYPTARATLQKLATVGGGPAFRRWGRIALYDHADLVAWAESRRSRKVASASELSLRPAETGNANAAHG